MSEEEPSENQKYKYRTGLYLRLKQLNLDIQTFKQNSRGK